MIPALILALSSHAALPEEVTLQTMIHRLQLVRYVEAKAMREDVEEAERVEHNARELEAFGP